MSLPFVPYRIDYAASIGFTGAPSLTLVVTEDSVRKRKRLVMFVPGWWRLRFIVRQSKGFSCRPSDIVVAVRSGLHGHGLVRLSCWAGHCRFERYLLRMGARRIGWIVAWIGFVYGVQLSLLVLALLWLVGYDYAKHPDGPAMMALIIPARRWPETPLRSGMRWLEASGRPSRRFRMARRWVAATDRPAACCLGDGRHSGMCESIGVDSSIRRWGSGGVLAGRCGDAGGRDGQSLAFLPGQSEGVDAQAGCSSMGELVKFWWWPGLAFAATYHLVLGAGCTSCGRCFPRDSCPLSPACWWHDVVVLLLPATDARLKVVSPEGC